MPDFERESFLNDRASSRSREQLSSDIRNSKVAIGYHAGFLALGAGMTTFQVVPRLFEASNQTDMLNVAQYGLIGAGVIAVSKIVVENICLLKAYLTQAQLNQATIDATEDKE